MQKNRFNVVYKIFPEYNETVFYKSNKIIVYPIGFTLCTQCDLPQQWPAIRREPFPAFPEKIEEPC